MARGPSDTASDSLCADEGRREHGDRVRVAVCRARVRTQSYGDGGSQPFRRLACVCLVPPAETGTCTPLDMNWSSHSHSRLT